ncbi:MAG: type II secretion system protein [Cetobacterium sp.]|uniref:type II secretion system protein n=1 Tax=Cetobacterium sp. TaxID=2071632 RepID=UPI003F3A61FE
MRNKGFTMIEVIVVLAIVGALSGFVVPKARHQIAQSKNLEAINILLSLRTANALSYIEKNEVMPNGNFSTGNLNLLKEYLPDNINKKITESDNNLTVKIGGSKNSNGEIIYGGNLILIVENGEIKVNPEPSGGEFNLNGEKWNDI